MNNRISAVVRLYAVTLLVAVVGAGCASLHTADAPADDPQNRAAIERRLQEIFAAADRLGRRSVFPVRVTALDCLAM